MAEPEVGKHIKGNKPKKRMWNSPEEMWALLDAFEARKALEKDAIYNEDPEGKNSTLHDFEDEQMASLKDLLKISDELRLGRIGKDIDLFSSRKRRLHKIIDGEFRMKDINGVLRKCRIYIFNDLVLVAKWQTYKGKKAYKKKMADEAHDANLARSKTQSEAEIFGEMIDPRKYNHNGEDDGIESDSEEAEITEKKNGKEGKVLVKEESGTSLDADSKQDEKKKKKKKKKKKLKIEVDENYEYVRLEMRMWLDLKKVSVRLLHETKSNTHGVSLTYVFINKETREHIVKSTEFWCNSEQIAEELIDPIIEVKDALTQEEIKEREEALKNNKGPRKRKYYASITKMKKIQAARQRYAGSYGKDHSLTDDEFIKMSLKELHDRYRISPEQAAEKKKEIEAGKKDGKEGEKTEKQEAVIFETKFEEGSLGLQISSHPDVGVFVARISERGLADVAGIAIGDRVLEINGKFIPRDKDWKECLEALKARPVTIKLTRTNLQDEKYVADKEAKEKLEAEAIEEDMKKRREARKNRPKTQRKWKQARENAKKYGGKLENLDDLERYYKEGKKKVKDVNRVEEFMQKWIKKTEKPEQTIWYALEEIYRTERQYVNDMMVLIYEFKRPIEKATVFPMCNERDEKFCEHDRPSTECDLQSTKSTKMLTEGEVSRIFMSIENLVKVNKTILDNIDSSIIGLIEKNGDNVTVADVIHCYRGVFGKLAGYLKLYVSYCQSYVGANHFLQKAITHIPELGRLIEQIDRKRREYEAEQDKPRATDMKTLLQLPGLRLTKYPLLFSSLEKHAEAYMRDEVGFICDDENEANNYKSRQFQQLDKKYGDAKEPDFEDRKTMALKRITEMVDDMMFMYSSYQKTAQDVEAMVAASTKHKDLYVIYEQLGGDAVVADLLKSTRQYDEQVQCFCKFEGEKTETEITLFIFKDLIVGAVPKPGTLKKLLTFGKSPLVAGRDSVMPGKQTKAKEAAKEAKAKESGTGSISTHTTRSGSGRKSSKSSKNSAKHTGKRQASTKRTKGSKTIEGTVKATMKPRLWIDLIRARQITELVSPLNDRHGFQLHLAVRVGPGDYYRKKKNKKDSQETMIECYNFYFDDPKLRTRIMEKLHNYSEFLRADVRNKKKLLRAQGVGPKPRAYITYRDKNLADTGHKQRLKHLEVLVKKRKELDSLKKEASLKDI